MEKKRESGEILEHMLLEEVKPEQISFREPPEEWDPELYQKDPYIPPVLIEERSSADTEGEQGSKKYTLLAHHRSFWRMHAKGPLSVRTLVVRSNVHITLAHESIKNCIEEALLFDGLLRNGLCENRSRLSELLGYSRARITQILNLMKLPSRIRRKLLLTDEVNEFQLRPLVRISDSKKQTVMFTHLIEGKFTGRQMALFANKDRGGEKELIPDIKDLMAEPGESEEEKQLLFKEEPVALDVKEKSKTPIQTVHLMKLIQDIGSMRESNWEIAARQNGIAEIDIIFLRGVSMLRNGLYEEAVNLLEEVIGNNPDYAPAYFYIGRCGNLAGDFVSAENSLRTALELAPDNPDYLVELAIVLEKLKRNSEASTFYKRAGLLRRRSTDGEEK